MENHLNNLNLALAEHDRYIRKVKEERSKNIINLPYRSNFETIGDRLEDFYIGKSKNLRKRIAEHLIEASLQGDLNYNEKSLFIQGILSVRKIDIKIIDDNPLNEIKLINEHYPEKPLLNISGVTRENRELKCHLRKQIYPKGVLLHPVVFKNREWFKKECDTMFSSFYSCKESLRDDCSVYVGDGISVRPDGSFSDF